MIRYNLLAITIFFYFIDFLDKCDDQEICYLFVYLFETIQ